MVTYRKISLKNESELHVNNVLPIKSDKQQMAKQLVYKNTLFRPVWNFKH